MSESKSDFSCSFGRTCASGRRGGGASRARSRVDKSPAALRENSVGKRQRRLSRGNARSMHCCCGQRTEPKPTLEPRPILSSLSRAPLLLPNLSVPPYFRMPSTYIASESMNVSSTEDNDKNLATVAAADNEGAEPGSPVPNIREEAPESPKTPDDIQKIPRDESFKTCKAADPSPRLRREGLRKTPARMSVFSGGKPYKEAGGVSSGRKFNSRRKNNNTSQNHLANVTANSNETFVKCEQELMFEGDSLEGPAQVGVGRRDAKPLVQQQLHQAIPEPLFETESEVPQSKPIESISPRFQQLKTKQPSPKKQVPKQIRPDTKVIQSRQMPPPSQPRAKPTQTREQLLKKNQRQQNQARRESQAIRNQFLTPKLPTFRKPPASLIGTASRYMNSFNTSRLTRSTSFKSTAELERDYFSSLRSS